MAFNLGELIFKMSADVASLRTDMGEAKRTVSEATERIAESVEKATSALELFGVALGTHEMIEWAKSSIEVADQANKTAQKIGLSTEALTGFQYAAKLADVDTESLQTGLVKLSKNMDAAADGSRAQAKAFDELGISVVDSRGKLRDVDSVVLDVAERFSHLQDGAQKAAIAQEIFGKAGANLIPFLNSGREGIQELRAEAERFGVVISGDTARAAEEFNDNLTRLKTQGAGFTNQIVSEMLPALLGISQALVEVNKNTTATTAIGEGLAFSLKGLVSAGATVVTTFRDIGDALGAYAAAGAQVLQGLEDTGRVFAKTATFQYGAAVEAAKVAGSDFQQVWRILDESSQRSSELIAANDDFIAKVWQKNDVAAVESAKLRTETITSVSAASTKAAEEAQKQIDQLMQSIMRAEGSVEQALEKLGGKSADDFFKSDQFKNSTKSSLDEIGADPEAEKKRQQAQNAQLEAERLRHEASMGDIESQWALKRLRLQEMTDKQKTKSAINEMISMTAGVAQHSRVLFEINKAATLASILLATPKAVAGAFAYGTEVGGPYVGAAFAALAAVVQATQFQAAASTTFEGGGSGTTPSAAGSGPVVNGIPTASSTGATALPTAQQNPSAPTINFYGDIHSNDAERLMKDIKSLINDADFVLIDTNSRQAAELRAA